MKPEVFETGALSDIGLHDLSDFEMTLSGRVRKGPFMGIVQCQASDDFAGGLPDVNRARPGL
jgi:hypothetical protein